jgi:hypothetical protein
MQLTHFENRTCDGNTELPCLRLFHRSNAEALCFTVVLDLVASSLKIKACIVAATIVSRTRYGTRVPG